MLGELCGRPPKPWTLSPQTFALQHIHSHPHPLVRFEDRCGTQVNVEGGAALIWRVISPAAAGGGDWRRDHLRPPADHEQRGEGSWNVAWDARPARWLYRLDVACLLLGVCLCLAPNVDRNHVVGAEVVEEEEVGEGGGVEDGGKDKSSISYRVIGVLADGRCLFRAIAHGACLGGEQEAPNENRERELADELRAQVVHELLKRRKEIELFIEGDFDAYVKRIEQPGVWGGEPELLMASHVLKKLISVYTKDINTGNLSNISNYGEEYKNEADCPIRVLFHGYGHYEILETSTN